mmetsp:Transcript_24080/g.44204  ORF Transcript_24080/g.44204 Transcript_24080/m.44204 type:complete len:223 (+) Transcript_24080:98-766(+)
MQSSQDGSKPKNLVWRTQRLHEACLQDAVGADEVGGNSKGQHHGGKEVGGHGAGIPARPRMRVEAGMMSSGDVRIPLAQVAVAQRTGGMMLVVRTVEEAVKTRSIGAGVRTPREQAAVAGRTRSEEMSGRRSVPHLITLWLASGLSRMGGKLASSQKGSFLLIGTMIWATDTVRIHQPAKPKARSNRSKQRSERSRTANSRSRHPSRKNHQSGTSEEVYLES